MHQEGLTGADVAIIGGGLAGAAAAILLARAGKQVILAERAAGPHHKVCGEFLSWEAQPMLAALGIDVAALGAPVIDRLRLADGARMIETVLLHPARSLSRYALDEALLQQAQAAGARLLRGTAVSGLERAAGTAGGWSLTFGNRETIAVPTVFLATGKHELRGWPRPREAANDLIGFKMHLALAPAQQAALAGHVEIHLFDGGYAGLEPVEGGASNLCFLVNKTVYAECGRNWAQLLHWLAAKTPVLGERLAGARELWPRALAVYGIPYGHLATPVPGEEGLYRLGDQMAVIPSFAGDGMAIALRSGFLAAEAYLGAHGARHYHRLARRKFRRPVRFASWIARAAAAPVGRRAVFTLARIAPGLLPAIMRSTRVSGF
jgi:flavin-dependent dehydrogenase